MNKLRKYYSTYLTILVFVMQAMYSAQAIKAFTTRSATDLSKSGFIASLIASIVWCVHGVKIRDYPLIVQGALASINSTAIVIAIYLYG